MHIITDNRFTSFMSTVGDLALLNIMWTLCCIPLVTYGASTAALYETVQSMQEGDDAHVVRHFWTIFRRRLGINIASTLLLGAFYALASFDVWYLGHHAGGTNIAALSYGIVATLSIVVMITTVFVFPLAGRSNDSLAAQFKRSLFLTLRYPLIALALTAMSIAPVIIAVFVPSGLAFVIFFWALLFTAVTAWIASNLMCSAGIIDAQAQ
ncbi:DUF624 domain-containing protein [Alloscardovia omnicolens]|uniref:DUF624 domain-containing protein n=1 Tax=Alloscardovia omnicolens TaxID=419015 RepID=UPI003A7475A7